MMRKKTKESFISSCGHLIVLYLESNLQQNTWSAVIIFLLRCSRRIPFYFLRRTIPASHLMTAVHDDFSGLYFFKNRRNHNFYI